MTEQIREIMTNSERMALEADYYECQRKETSAAIRAHAVPSNKTRAAYCAAESRTATAAHRLTLWDRDHGTKTAMWGHDDEEEAG